jgi:integrase
VEYSLSFILPGEIMTAQKLSASTPTRASTLLPETTNVVALSVARERGSDRHRAFTKASSARMHCPQGKQESLYWDASCRGFGLRALASGRRTWIYQYRDEHKRTRRLALGDVSAVPLEAARQAARRHAAGVTQGANPSAERKVKTSASSMLQVIQSYLQQARTRQRQRSYQETERHLLKHAAPLHHDRAEAVRRVDIAALLERISTTSGPLAANRLRAALSALWSWGMRAGLIESDSNPVAFTVRHPEKARDRTLADDELRAIWAATEGEGDYARIVRLCILTGCRRDEIGGLHWDELQDDRLLISGARMKSGGAHELPLLPDIAAALPERSQGASGNMFGRRKAGFSGWSKSKAALDDKLAKAGRRLPHWTLHDLRRTFSTRLHDAGVEPIVIEALLAHKQQGVAAVYNRASFRVAKKRALETWHKLLLGILGQSHSQSGTTGDG